MEKKKNNKGLIFFISESYTKISTESILISIMDIVQNENVKIIEGSPQEEYLKKLQKASPIYLYDIYYNSFKHRIQSTLEKSKSKQKTVVGYDGIRFEEQTQFMSNFYIVNDEKISLINKYLHLTENKNDCLPFRLIQNYRGERIKFGLFLDNNMQSTSLQLLSLIEKNSFDFNEYSELYETCVSFIYNYLNTLNNKSCPPIFDSITNSNQERYSKYVEDLKKNNEFNIYLSSILNKGIISDQEGSNFFPLKFYLGDIPYSERKIIEVI